MKKVFQTRTSKDNGNCAQAVIATLFGMEIEDVPDFVSNHHIKPMAAEIVKFHRNKGFKAGYIYKNDHKMGKSLLDIANNDDGVNGFFYAVVKSKTFEGSLHAVVVDKELNIIHDPNPNGRCLELHPDDVIQLLITNILYG
jgi:hypothetical protein